MRSNKLGVCWRDMGAEWGCEGAGFAPSGISPAFSTTNRGGVERPESLFSAKRRGSTGVGVVRFETYTVCVLNLYLWMMTAVRLIVQSEWNRCLHLEVLEDDRL